MQNLNIEVKNIEAALRFIRYRLKQPIYQSVIQQQALRHQEQILIERLEQLVGTSFGIIPQSFGAIPQSYSHIF